MESVIAEGYYDGEIVGAFAEMDYADKDLMMCFDIDLLNEGAGESVTARHFTEGELGKIGQRVAESLELEWPGCLRHMAPCIGKKVRVRVKHKVSAETTYVNAYIVTGKERKPASPEQVEMAIAKLEAKTGAVKDDQSECPF